MQVQKILVPLGSLLLLAAGYRFYGWSGIAVASGALVMWMLLHFTRLMQILRRATGRPVGHVDSAVMLNAKLRRGVTLMHTVALTRSLGALQSPKDAQPEVFRWTDSTQSHVTCTYVGGRLAHWELARPAPSEPAP
jgi:hypothetical protein